MNAARIARALRRMAHEVLEHHEGVEDLAIIGIRTRGWPLAQRFADLIEQAEGRRPPTGAVDVTFYRDDYRLRAKSPEEYTDLTFNVDDVHVVLVDDVLFTGRSVRAAIDALMDFGRPKTVQLAVLIDRGHRELPLKADYVGKEVQTDRDDTVRVRLKEIDGVDQVLLIRRTERP
jgi:pyrimidine operon attenuation protein/uracil phosphoribosyltransferase